mgnify:CR=1 FL=1
MSSSDDLSVGFVNIFILLAVFLAGLLSGAKFYQLTSNLEELEKKSYQECIESLPRNKDCKIASIQYEIVYKK